MDLLLARPHLASNFPSNITPVDSKLALGKSVDKGTILQDDPYDGTQAKMLAAHHAAQQPKLTSKSKGVILERYEQLYREGTTAKLKHKDRYYPTKQQLVQESTMKLDLVKQYMVSNLTFYNIISIVLGQLGGFLLPNNVLNLAMLNTTFFW